MCIKGTKKGKNSKGYDEKKDDEHIASIFVSLCKYLEESRLQRFLSKFTESSFEKVERMLEVHEKYLGLVRIADEKIEVERRELGNGYVVVMVTCVCRGSRRRCK